jgi:putative sensory transduction regulator
VSRLRALDVVARWIDALPEGTTFELVRDGFWYVRIPGVARSWIPIEIDVRERSLKLTSHVIIEPDENHAAVYTLLLRRNHRAGPVSYSIDGKEGVICLVGRISTDDLDQERLDEAVGTIVQETEEIFRSILQIGFASRFKKR